MIILLNSSNHTPFTQPASNAKLTTIKSNSCDFSSLSLISSISGYEKRGYLFPDSPFSLPVRGINRYFPTAPFSVLTVYKFKSNFCELFRICCNSRMSASIEYMYLSICDKMIHFSIFFQHIFPAHLIL